MMNCRVSDDCTGCREKYGERCVLDLPAWHILDRIVGCDHCFCKADFVFPPSVRCCKCGETRGLRVSLPKREKEHPARMPCGTPDLHRLNDCVCFDAPNASGEGREV